uniref:CNNM transmembrane domain-containing protein n=1 Tax=Fagus sylvatica TaxID=28930 RepID=A0A2N9J9V3_FAGSY
MQLISDNFTELRVCVLVELNRYRERRMAVEYECCGSDFFIHIVIIVFLVLFAGSMSGLTLGLMSMSLVDLEVLAKSGTPNDRKHAEKILPVVKKQHLLLCTLLICNAAAMEALPIFLDGLITAWGAILISVTLILLFGEIIPQSVCSRYGLAIGAAVAPFVRVLVFICYPVAYPISKLLDCLLGHGHVALFRRAELKTLVDFHGNEAGKGGELTHDETTIIAGALELSEKTASDAMTPISETFAIDINAKLDRDLMSLILEKGHSRVPVYYEQPTNIIGLILVKNLLTIHPEDEVPVKSVTIRRIPRVPETLPLYDILNEFQKGHSHMAVVVRRCNPTVEQSPSNALENQVKDVKINIDGEKSSQDRSLKSKRSFQKWKSFPNSSNNLDRGGSRSKKWSRDIYSDILQIDGSPLPKLPEEAVGIITMEDVIEELLQEEIFDETDHQFEDS